MRTRLQFALSPGSNGGVTQLLAMVVVWLLVLAPPAWKSLEEDSPWILTGPNSGVQ